MLGRLNGRLKIDLWTIQSIGRCLLVGLFVCPRLSTFVDVITSLLYSYLEKCPFLLPLGSVIPGYDSWSRVERHSGEEQIIDFKPEPLRGSRDPSHREEKLKERDQEENPLTETERKGRKSLIRPPAERVVRIRHTTVSLCILRLHFKTLD